MFDGRTAGPYTEPDAPNPLNVYGRTKAEAERRVLDLHADALVIRSSAFFGPWDEHNYLAWFLRVLDAGDRFNAPSDTVVSPTYVPHLVDATLDLMIDDERGIWHLANRGAVTWFEFAQQAAALCGHAPDRIRPVDAAAVWRPAARPPFSVLASRRGDRNGGDSQQSERSDAFEPRKVRTSAILLHDHRVPRYVSSGPPPLPQPEKKPLPDCVARTRG